MAKQNETKGKKFTMSGKKSKYNYQICCIK